MMLASSGDTLNWGCELASVITIVVLAHLIVQDTIRTCRRDSVTLRRVSEPQISGTSLHEISLAMHTLTFLLLQHVQAVVMCFFTGPRPAPIMLCRLFRENA